MALPQAAKFPGWWERNEVFMKITFEDFAQDNPLFRYAVIVCRCRGKWVYARHKERNTWEIPGGRREPGEQILHTAHRELYEETGALEYNLQPVAAYCVESAEKSFGLLCFAEITQLAPLPGMEIAEIHFYNSPPENLTYPAIQPALFNRVLDFLAARA